MRSERDQLWCTFVGGHFVKDVLLRGVPADCRRTVWASRRQPSLLCKARDASREVLLAFEARAFQYFAGDGRVRLARVNSRTSREKPVVLVNNSSPYSPCQVNGAVPLCGFPMTWLESRSLASPGQMKAHGNTSSSCHPAFRKQTPVCQSSQRRCSSSRIHRSPSRNASPGSLVRFPRSTRGQVSNLMTGWPS